MKEERLVIPKEAAGMGLLDYLNTLGLSFSAPCGGNGTCGKCRVKLSEGGFALRSDPSQALLPEKDGSFLACRALCCERGAVILLPETEGEGLALTVEAKRGERSSSEATGVPAVFGAALDIGTTTLAAALVEMHSGKLIATASALNPQSGFGADVMSRIDASTRGMLSSMQATLMNSVRMLLDTLADKAKEQGIETLSIKDMTVAGNPTMLHIFAGVSPEGMGRYPFTPVFLDVKRLSGESLGLPCERITLLPSASAFIGGDVIGGLYVARMREEEKPTLLLDIGTNGEILLCTGKEKGNRLFAASAAAGPALEGARISCGMGGVNGAVSRVYEEEGGLVYETVGDSSARGLSGSGLVDLTACLLKRKEIDCGGYLEKESVRLVGRQKKGGLLSPAAPTAVTLLASDVRELQLAKSALRSALEMLLASAEIKPEEITATFLAGGLGYYINPESAVAIGLMPKTLSRCVKALGNASLSGAIAVLLDEEALDEMASCAAACVTLELNEEEDFFELFTDYMLFPDA